MVQSIIIGLLVMAALFYLGRMVYKAFQGKASCGGGCAKCALPNAGPSAQ
jgi:hypothetical protein